MSKREDHLTPKVTGVITESQSDDQQKNLEPLWDVLMSWIRGREN